MSDPLTPCGNRPMVTPIGHAVNYEYRDFEVLRKSVFATFLLLPAGETHAFWVTLRPGRAAAPGAHPVEVCVHAEPDRPTRLAARLNLHDVVVGCRRGFAVTHWFYNDALLDHYGCTAFDERFWGILPAYLRDLAEHGQDTVYTPVFTPPLDGVKRPTQLLRVQRRAPGRYAFDWTDVERYVKLARRCGIENLEWTHLFTQWGARHAVRIYAGQGADERLLWPADTAATSTAYRRFLAQFLPQLERFLTAHRLHRRSFFHVSDEPHGAEAKANYVAARALLGELAPWMRTMDALTDIAYGRERLTDMPIPSTSTMVPRVSTAASMVPSAQSQTASAALP